MVRTKEQTNEDQNTANFSVSLHRFIAVDLRHALSAERKSVGFGILFSFTVPGQMVLVGKAFTTFLSRMATTSASSKSRRRRLKTMWRPTKRILALQDGPMHSCRSQLWRSRNYRSGNGSIGCRIGVRRGPHAGCRRERVRGRKALSERPRQVGRHKEDARRFHLYRPGAIS